MKFSAVTLAAACMLVALAQAQYQCTYQGPRSNCGVVGTTQQQCLDKGCCWGPVNPNPDNEPYCFYPQAVSPPAPSNGAPFSDREVEMMRGYFLNNIDILGKGGVVASPDTDTGAGGTYYFHWMRDAALSMHALVMTGNNTSQLDYFMKSYVKWVLQVQNEPDPNGIDVRIEPKFNLPNGEVFAGSWCRPQTDGPGLRSATLSLYAMYLIEHGGAAGKQFVANFLYNSTGAYNGGAIKYDLEWVVNNWPSNGCDLWEEVESTDFFWNRYMFRYGLTMGAKVATAMGDQNTANTYLNTANTIKSTLGAHYNGQYVYESTNRMKDAAVILAFNDGYLDDGYFSPTSTEVAGTISTLNSLFYSMFSFNNNKDVPLYGRYQGDTYDDGNPWILTTAAIAQLFYNGASEVLHTGKLPSATAMAHFRDIIPDLPDDASLTAYDFARAMSSTGDKFMFRLRDSVAPYNFHLSEQLDKNVGFQMSAYDLTWSYATVLKAMYYRNNAMALME